MSTPVERSKMVPMSRSDMKQAGTIRLYAGRASDGTITQAEAVFVPSGVSEPGHAFDRSLAWIHRLSGWGQSVRSHEDVEDVTVGVMLARGRALKALGSKMISLAWNTVRERDKKREARAKFHAARKLELNKLLKESREDRLESAALGVIEYIDHLHEEHLPGCSATTFYKGETCDCGLEALRVAMALFTN